VFYLRHHGYSKFFPLCCRADFRPLWLFGYSRQAALRIIMRHSFVVLRRGVVKKLLIAGAALAALMGTPALAADTALKAAPAPVYKAAPIVQPGGWYVFVDGMYERVRLPGYSLGFAGEQNAAPSGNTGAFNHFSPDLDGAGVRGGIGYFVPGARWRLEAAGSYVHASGSNSQGFAPSGIGAYTPLLNGTAGGFGFNCSLGLFRCTESGTLNTSYSSWQAYGKAAYDTQFFRSGLVAPFVALFGGNSRNHENLAQGLSQFNAGTLVNTGTYTTSTALRWSDFGARVGVDATAPVNSWLSWSFNGWVGVAARDVSLNGSDIAASTIAMAGASSLSTSATTTAVVANAETGFSVKVTQATTLRGFVGVNFDSRVPGITAPTWASLTGIVELGATPASISYSSETSYYAGGGIAVKF
jgi:hypothetical protein